MASDRMGDEEFDRLCDFEEDWYSPPVLRIVREARRARASEAALREENDCLRAIASKIMPCHYCGLDDVSKCRSGFPGCALMDDRLGGDECANEVVREIRAENERLVAQLADTHRESSPAYGSGEDFKIGEHRINPYGETSKLVEFADGLVKWWAIDPQYHDRVQYLGGREPLRTWLSWPLAAPETRGEGE